MKCIAHFPKIHPDIFTVFANFWVPSALFQRSHFSLLIELMQFPEVLEDALVW